MVALATLGAAVVAAPAQAAVSVAAPVIISEVYGGGGNSGAAYNRDFIELYNRSGAPVDLSSWSVQYTSTTGGTWQVTPLSGVTLAAGSFLLVGEATGTTTTLPGFTPDVSGTIAISSSGGKVALVNAVTPLTGSAGLAQSPAVVDYVGWGAATDFAGASAAPATANATSLSRDAANTHTANNAADFTAGVPSPTGQGTVPVDPTEKVLAIAEIQGTGDVSPVVGSTVRTSGVVTAAYPTGGLSGFVIQTPGTGGESELSARTASDAIFVYSPDTVGSVAVGDTVEVVGVVSEHYGLTEITVKAGGVTALPAASAPIPITAPWPADAAKRETLESMLYLPAESFTVSNTYTTHQYGEVALATGTTPLRQPTDVARPGTPEAAAVVADNAARLITLDDGSSTNYLSPANTALVPAYVSLSEPIVVGSQARLTAAHIVDYRNDTWKLNPTSPLVGGSEAVDGVDFTNQRTTAPASVGGDVTVASFNVLNYFTTLGDENPSCVAYTDRAGNGVSVKDGCNQRGAWDRDDFTRQQTKIVKAINGLNASVVGLMEVENSARLGEATDEALSSLVAALNADAGTTKWAFVPSAANLPDTAQQDVITSALIYQPAAVTPSGATVALSDQSGAGGAFQNAREPIAQSFVPAAGGTVFTVVVNHFKSKGSVGPWPGDVDKGDGQGTSNESRVRQATALRDWVATDPTGSGSPDYLLIGDFNSYGQEDPLQVLYGAGFADAEHQFGLTASTYVFQGLSGSLDHVLLSSSIIERTTGAAVWNINSGEALALEYSRYNSVGALYYEPSPYRSSDHDPVIVGLASGYVPPTTATITTDSWCAGGKLHLDVTATNLTGQRASVSITAVGSDKTFRNVKDGRSVTLKVNTKSKTLEAGSLTAVVTPQGGVPVTVQSTYEAKACK